MHDWLCLCSHSYVVGKVELQSECLYFACTYYVVTVSTLVGWVHSTDVGSVYNGQKDVVKEFRFSHQGLLFTALIK